MQSYRVFAAAVATVLMTATWARAQPTVFFATETDHREMWRGETTGSQAGFSLDRGDVHAGDDRRDLIVGAPGWQSQTGRVYVNFGGLVRRGEVSFSASEAKLTGAAAGDRFGHATAAGYITAREADDPIPNRDLVVGAPGANGGSGAVYLFLRGLTHGQSLTTADAILTITGAPAGAQLGAALATGDLDGDGYREIIIGAPGTGSVYVVHGGPTATGSLNLATPSSAFFLIHGASAAGIGRGLAAGDITGDGLYDLAISAHSEGGIGAVYVIYGRPANTFPATMGIVATANARFGGIDSGDMAGWAVEIAPFDGDLVSDLIIGAPGADGPANSRANGGEIYVIWGNATHVSRSLSAADLTIYGESAGHFEGSDLAIGDVDRRAPSDFVSLAPGAADAGELHVVLGRSRAAFGTVYDLAVKPMDRRLVGDPDLGQIATALIYDLTGEGAEDVLAGMPGSGEGLVYVSFSSLSTLETRAGKVGDFDGDGASDVAVFNPFTANWKVRNQFTVQFGQPRDVAVAGDYDGDGDTDLAVYRPSTGEWIVRDQFTVQFGEVGDIPMPGDYNGDGVTDVAVYRPTTGTWFLRNQVTVQFGSRGDVPVPGDYNGDGATDIAVYRPSSGMWFVRNQLAVHFGDPGDVPTPGDYNGDGLTDVSVYRVATGWWYVRNQFGAQIGQAGDRPVPRDYDGDSRTDIAVYRPSTGEWIVRNQPTVVYGATGDMPAPRGPLGPVLIPGDYDGNMAADVAVFRPSTGMWMVRNKPSVQHGASGDTPVPGDYDGNGIMEPAVYRPSTNTWLLRNRAPIAFGMSGDVPVPGDYNGDGVTDVAVFRPSTGTWDVRGQFTVQFGDPGDVPVPGDYNNDGLTDVAIYRPSTGTWYVRNQFGVQFGDAGDVPVVGDYNGDGRTDVAVYRPSTGMWFVRNVLAAQFGDASDKPVQADYNGDGTMDLAVYRPSTGMWYVRNQFAVQLGNSSDIPVVKVGPQ